TGAQLMLAAHWNGTAWAAHVVPAPNNFYGQSLLGGSCPSATACFAVGSYFQEAGNQITLAELWNGKTWALQATPSGFGKYLVSVSCASTTACTAAGSYLNKSGVQQALAERWNGRAWAAETAANPAGSG